MSSDTIYISCEDEQMMRHSRVICDLVGLTEVMTQRLDREQQATVDIISAMQLQSEAAGKSSVQNRSTTRAS